MRRFQEIRWMATPPKMEINVSKYKYLRGLTTEEEERCTKNSKTLDLIAMQA